MNTPQGFAQRDIFGELTSLARNSPSRITFFKQALRAIARQFASPYATIHVRFPTEVIHDDWHLGPTDPKFWKASVQRFLTDVLAEPRSHAQLLLSRSQKTKVAFLASPVHDPSGRAIGCLALVASPTKDGDIEDRLRALEAMVRLTSYSAAFVGMEADRSSVVVEAGQKGSGAAAKALARAAQCQDLDELAFALTNDLCNKLGCEQIALGMTRGRSVEVVSISGMDTISRQSPGVVCLRAAMEECLDANRTLVCQSGQDWADERIGQCYRLHRQWQSAARGDAVASLPLRINDRCVAVLSMRRRADDPFSADALEHVGALIGPFAPALVLTQRANRTLRRHLLDSIRGRAEMLISPGRRGTRIATFCAVTFSLWFCFGSMDYALTIPCKVRPERVRHVTAPLEAVLVSAAVVEGDVVREGDVLCVFDQRELEQNRRELLAELAVSERMQDRARAGNRPVEVELARANQQLVQARLNLVNMRIEQATLRAPFDGMVVAGDLRKSIGGVIERGQPLFEVAPLDTWMLELYVPDNASDDLAPDLKGRFASRARPDETESIIVERVLPQARVHGGRNVYVAEARIARPAAWIRAGLEGVARVEVGPRKVWWITLHRAVDYLRMKFWL